MPERRGHLTIGEAKRQPVLVIHGTAGSAMGRVAESFADELFAPVKPLDATKCFNILPNTVGARNSSKPSDGLREEFPAYTIIDMVNAQHALVSDHLKIPHLRLVMGNSMGGMGTWTWGTEYPDYMKAVVPMASVPDPMSGSNWMMRRMVIDSVRNDPAGRAATTPNNRRNCVSPAHGLRWQRSGAKSACRSWVRTMKWRMPLSISAWRTSRSDNDAPLIGGAAARANDRFNHLLWVPCCTRLGPLPALHVYEQRKMLSDDRMAALAQCCMCRAALQSGRLPPLANTMTT